MLEFHNGCTCYYILTIQENWPECDRISNFILSNWNWCSVACGICYIMGANLLAIYCYFLLYIIFSLVKNCCCTCVALHAQRSKVHSILNVKESINSPSSSLCRPLVNHPTTSEITLIDCSDDGYADCLINPSRYNRKLRQPASN